MATVFKLKRVGGGSRLKGGHTLKGATQPIEELFIPLDINISSGVLTISVDRAILDTQVVLAKLDINVMPTEIPVDIQVSTARIDIQKTTKHIYDVNLIACSGKVNTNRESIQ